MSKIDITSSELFLNMLELDFKDQIIDLHNDYLCKKVYYDQNLILEFMNKNNKIVNLIFQEANLIKLQMPLKISDGLTIDNFHRGRYELNNKLYDEYKEKKCFYIEFYENGYVELLCKHAFIEISN